MMGTAMGGRESEVSWSMGRNKELVPCRGAWAEETKREVEEGDEAELLVPCEGISCNHGALEPGNFTLPT